MSALQSRHPNPALRALREDLRDAEDGKIRQIVAMLDDVTGQSDLPGGSGSA